MNWGEYISFPYAYSASVSVALASRLWICSQLRKIILLATMQSTGSSDFKEMYSPQFKVW